MLLNGGTKGGSGQAKKNTVDNSNTATSGGSNTLADNAPAAPTDPRAESFELVDDKPDALWAPPRRPDPFAIDQLPPGAQVFVALRPARLYNNAESKSIVKLLDPDLAPVWSWIKQQTGLNADEISRAVIAVYAGQSGQPTAAIRVEMTVPRTVAELKQLWKSPSENKVGQQSLLTSGSTSYYISKQPLVDSQSIEQFSVGPAELMRDVAEAQGGAGPLPSQLEKLWQGSDRDADLTLLFASSFWSNDGLKWKEQWPKRLSTIADAWLNRDLRAVLFTTSLDKEWYYEVRVVGNSDRDAASNSQRLGEAIRKWPQDVEAWFVNELPHPHWRALALRFPNMLRALSTQTRTGTESGQAIANGYLPKEAAPNLMYATWLATQSSSTQASGAVAGGNTSSSNTPLTAEQILARPITVTLDQQPIEVVLQLIGEQANDGLPAGTKPLQFLLDGPAFQRSGITRNQQIRGFNIANKPVREALTELAKRGNPVLGVTDTRAADQRLLWLLINADKPGEATVSLTTREAAAAGNLTLPKEFAP